MLPIAAHRQRASPRLPHHSQRCPQVTQQPKFWCVNTAIRILLFEEAKNSQPSIIFFDGLAPVRSDPRSGACLFGWCLDLAQDTEPLLV
ncbi:hypothetical protein NEOLEDRAFT_1142601 [Neolentinus lepideus HHB14362 ss-1]|uniref:Uncharacterized protein n=1 Tax=Neolentinus lepideus HHB14362 ss-1 TaxID=1314782 RepID=A0A165M609_9AGAM|nr:hypothetical protein NEOLEDRAFT_1143979 [Neolentinus lepideus HHB14362 ss-1]KZT19082.1 hypothetical protein NEOLEDRAFT_1142601 [Neolentinus lepideus HHB14362 ss-1]